MFLEIVAGVAGAMVTAGVALRLFFPWVLLDIRYLMRAGKILRASDAHVRTNTFLVDLFEKRVVERKDKAFVVFEGKEFSYQYINEKANRLGRAMLKVGLSPGDTVAVMIYNEPAFLWTYLGLQKIGIPVACLNHNLRNKSLVHCIRAVEPKAVIVGEGTDLLSAIQAVMSELPDVRLLLLGPRDESASASARFESVGSLMEDESGENIPRQVRAHLKFSDPAVMIYTSGTTGLPKAAVVPHRKVLIAAYFFHALGATAEDRLYLTLPLYHTSALCIGLGSVVTYGSTLVLRKKFSASEFWSDCRKYDVGIFMYIGELCRYLLARPESSEDRNHKVRIAVGNGLRQDIYETFQSRFGIGCIGEFYGSTEGNLGFLNCLNVPRSCGRSSPLLQKVVICDFVKVDIDTEQPIRKKSGLCIRADIGEPGLMVGKLTERQSFNGYKGSRAESEKKYLKDVFRKGDRYFNSGDLLIRDSHYNLYFSDRLGDTFRWKGENVSTTEVSNVLAELDFISDAAVYGVSIPGCEGRAGMACLSFSDGVESLVEDKLESIHRQVEEYLPSYARPLFLRVKPQLEMTSTFKQTKVTLKQEAFNIEIIADKLYYLQKSSGRYTVLDKHTHQCIMNRNISF